MAEVIDVDFNTALSRADKLITQQNVAGFKIDVLKLNYNKNIIFDTIDNYCKITNTRFENLTCKGKLKDGYVIVMSSGYLILYNDTIKCKERINWTLAHEVGHVYLDHKSDGKKEEVEAHFFAAQLLMPEQVVRNIRQNEIIVNESFLIDTFSVSPIAAEKRIKTLNNKPDISRPRDNQILDLYETFIIDLLIKHGKICPYCHVKLDNISSIICDECLYRQKMRSFIAENHRNYSIDSRDENDKQLEKLQFNWLYNER